MDGAKSAPATATPGKAQTQAKSAVPAKAAAVKGATFGEHLGLPSRAQAAMATSASKAIVKAPSAMPTDAKGHASPKASAEHGHSKEREKPRDLLDPSERQAAQLAPPMLQVQPVMHAATPTEAAARASLETILPALVKRIAWSGDGRKGSVRMEIGAGALQGATLLVHADDGRVQVQLSAPAGVDAEEWRARIAKRLQIRGIDVERVDIE